MLALVKHGACAQLESEALQAGYQPGKVLSGGD